MNNYNCSGYNGYDQQDWNIANMDERFLDYFDLSQYNPYSDPVADLDQCLLDSQPLSRLSSSDGSSCQPTTPTSSETYYSLSTNPTVEPTLLQQHVSPPYYVDQCSPTSMAAEDYPSTPPTVMSVSGRPRSSTQSSTGHTCPQCPSKPPFKRRADLNRHIQHIHKPPSTFYPCDYPRCARRHEPFHRRDHFRDHLREFHREDIDKRGVHLDESWYHDRNTVDSWWRCNRCLGRVSVDKHGFECPLCKGRCCPRRQEARKR